MNHTWTRSPWHFRHPFLESEGYEFVDEKATDLALTLAELRMIKLSYTIRSKPLWKTKYKDPEIRAKWRVEALEQEVLGGKATEAEVDYVLDELEEHLVTENDETGVKPSCYDRIWQSDALIPLELHDNLIAQIAVLEHIPEEDRDWHPRSNNQVEDLVHPSLYCLVYGRTLAYPPIDKCPIASRTSDDLGTIGGPQVVHDPETYHRSAYRVEDYAMSDRFAWIPTDFLVSRNGDSATPLGYINNLHPSHTELYDSLSQVVARFTHLFDRVLTDIHPANTIVRRIKGSYSYPPGDNYPDQNEGESQSAYRKRADDWRETRPIIFPTVPKRGYRRSAGGQNERRVEPLNQRRVEYSIQGRECQVIIKLANIHLTPEKPTYPGGSWHVEGMGNERIVASGIYYYSSENITESQLAFRNAVSFSSDWYEQNDTEGVMRTFGLKEGQGSNQPIGAVPTSEGRCIAFPNIYQHRVSPFELVDKTKPGYRKIIALFLVDPALGQDIHKSTKAHKKISASTVHPKIPSTSVIPPQQFEWVRKALDSIPSANPFQKLPLELKDTIMKHLQTQKFPVEGESQAEKTEVEVGATMTFEEAKQYRLELMDERTGFVRKQDDKLFVSSFNLCEH